MPLRERNILIIDDSPGIRTFLNVSLRGNGASIYEAPDAAKGLHLFRAVQPDLVILDLGLPDRDGLDLLPELKEIGMDGYIPKVIVLSVRNDTYSRNKAFERGADGYVTKPFMMEELNDHIETAFYNGQPPPPSEGDGTEKEGAS